MKILPILLLLATPLTATYASSPSPYQGMEQRPIKALSRQQIDDYLAGRGMGQAMAAELNHYPGPLHVLELKEELVLGDDQIEQTQKLFATMQQQARKLGEQLVEGERALDRAFAEGNIDTKRLKELLEAIAEVQKELRFVHLQAHLQQKRILSRHQQLLYDRLRGYAGENSHRHDPGTH